jgi:hypothetical protein
MADLTGKRPWVWSPPLTLLEQKKSVQLGVVVYNYNPSTRAEVR